MTACIDRTEFGRADKALDLSLHLLQIDAAHIAAPRVSWVGKTLVSFPPFGKEFGLVKLPPLFQFLGHHLLCSAVLSASPDKLDWKLKLMHSSEP